MKPTCSDMRTDQMMYYLMWNVSCMEGEPDFGAYLILAYTTYAIEAIDTGMKEETFKKVYDQIDVLMEILMA